MKKSFLLLLIAATILGIISCKKSKVDLVDQPYTEPADMRLGTYTGMFQECGSVVCYNKDTSFKVVKEDGKYFLVFGDHKDQIEYWSNAAIDFRSTQTSVDISGPVFNGYCRNDSFFVVFTTAWGIYNNNLLSGKKN